MNAMIWLILFVVLVVFEIATMGLTTIWFAAGALIAFFLVILLLSLRNKTGEKRYFL